MKTDRVEHSIWNFSTVPGRFRLRIKYLLQKEFFVFQSQGGIANGTAFGLAQLGKAYCVRVRTGNVRAQSGRGFDFFLASWYRF